MRRYTLSESMFACAIACLALLLLAPLFVSRCIEKPFSLGLPVVETGDEPHYLVLINSVISDGDFDLANNYRDVHRGGLLAGRKFTGAPLDHHINFDRTRAADAPGWHPARGAPRRPRWIASG